MREINLDIIDAKFLAKLLKVAVEKITGKVTKLNKIHNIISNYFDFENWESFYSFLSKKKFETSIYNISITLKKIIERYYPSTDFSYKFNRFSSYTDRISITFNISFYVIICKICKNENLKFQIISTTASLNISKLKTQFSFLFRYNFEKTLRKSILFTKRDAESFFINTPDLFDINKLKIRVGSLSAFNLNKLLQKSEFITVSDVERSFINTS